MKKLFLLLCALGHGGAYAQTMASTTGLEGQVLQPNTWYVFTFHVTNSPNTNQFFKFTAQPQSSGAISDSSWYCNVEFWAPWFGNRLVLNNNSTGVWTTLGWGSGSQANNSHCSIIADSSSFFSGQSTDSTMSIRIKFNESNTWRWGWRMDYYPDTWNSWQNPGTTFITGNNVPAITGLSPNAGSVGTPVTISGTGFGTSQGTSTITFNGINAGTATTWSAGSIVANVPTGATTGNVVVTVGGLASNATVFTINNGPTITGLSPSSGPIGTPVTISGTGFGTSQGTSTITFNGTSAGTATTWTATSITINVPTGATTGNVVVTAGGLASNAMFFTVGQSGGGGGTWVTGSGGAIYFTGGNVGIGSTSPQHKLSVNGTIGTKEVIVTNTGWSDYVFQPGYRLRPLSEVSAYIQAHRHLPDIPSEAEVKEKGVGVGDMQAKLLAKIEELTLHMIQQERENQELRERVARLEKGAEGAMSAVVR